MGLGYIRGGGGGGINSADVTAYKADVLKGKRTITADSGDEVAEGTMPDNTGINTNGTVPGISSAYPNTPTRPGTGLQLQTATDGVKRINISPPKGYYQGNNGSYVNRPASEFGNATAAQVLSGRKFTSEHGLNISGSIPSKAAATYYANASADQTIAAGQYLSGAQTIKKLTQTNFSAANIKKGVTISVNNGSGNVWSLTGTWEGYVTNTSSPYNRGVWLSGWNLAGCAKPTGTGFYSANPLPYVQYNATSFRVVYNLHAIDNGGWFFYLPVKPMNGINNINISYIGTWGVNSTYPFILGVVGTQPPNGIKSSAGGDATQFNINTSSTKFVENPNISRTAETTITLNVSTINTNQYIYFGPKYYDVGIVNEYLDITHIWFS